MQITTAGDALPSLSSSSHPEKMRLARPSTIGSGTALHTETSPNQNEAYPHQNTVNGAIAAANQAMVEANAQVQFAIDNESGRTLIKVVDTESKRVIRQIPTEEILVIARNIDRLQGLIVRGVA